jgi:hypothetical protein
MTSPSSAHLPTTQYFSTAVGWYGSGTSAWLRLVVCFGLVGSAAGLRRSGWGIFRPLQRVGVGQ